MPLNMAQAAKISVLSQRLGEHVEISVENEIEKKISEEELARLFIPFYRQREEGAEPGLRRAGLGHLPQNCREPRGQYFGAAAG